MLRRRKGSIIIAHINLERTNFYFKYILNMRVPLRDSSQPVNLAKGIIPFRFITEETQVNTAQKSTILK